LLKALIQVKAGLKTRLCFVNFVLFVAVEPFVTFVF